MDKSESGPFPLENRPREEWGTESTQPGSINSPAVAAEAVRVRAARAKRIEEISYRLTDLVAIIPGL